MLFARITRTGCIGDEPRHRVLPNFTIIWSNVRPPLLNLHRRQPQPPLYIGVTGNLLRRAFQHKWKEFEGFSAKYNCDRLVWFEHCQEVAKAIARETQLKKWNRAKKIALTERMNPTWQDLSKD